ncbi:MAG: esterase [Chloroflexi bacterium]|nr:esterase [Chloroflexota bacterium]MCI0578054.1 esterase [Chloroflexota bacterium]MCI0649262.1 esterase [Chloroflexota bacterium]MCI0728846.1 esterase [Chloroflexota bacterium]
MAQIVTTLGPKTADELDLILPHEHVFVDLRRWNEPGYAQAEAADVVRLMAPEIEKARAAGVTAIVECSTGGVGRRADIDRAVSESTSFPLVVPTGFYREPWIPDWVHAASEAKLREWLLAELEDEIEASGVTAGWIKLSAGDDGLTACETKILRAAAAAGVATNAVIGSHTIRGRVVQDQLAIIEAAGYTPERFIWIHTQAEPDSNLHLEMARRGAWIEYDAIGNEERDDFFLNLIRRVLDAGLGHRLLLSHDRGWYDPSLPGGGTPQPYTYLCEHFLPKLRASGVDEATIHQLTHTNPFQAFARPTP